MVFKSLPHAKQEAVLTSPMLSAPIENSSRSLILVYATCIYIAAKVVDRPQYRGLLTAMLSAIIGQQVSSKEVNLDSIIFNLPFIEHIEVRNVLSFHFQKNVPFFCIFRQLL